MWLSFRYNQPVMSNVVKLRAFDEIRTHDRQASTDYEPDALTTAPRRSSISL